MELKLYELVVVDVLCVASQLPGRGLIKRTTACDMLVGSVKLSGWSVLAGI